MKKYIITVIVAILAALVAYFIWQSNSVQPTTISEEGFITNLEGEILSSPGNSSLER